MSDKDLGKKISIFAAQMVPSHVRESYPQFVLFIEKFFEYIERDLGEYDIVTYLRDYADIDNTVDAFLGEFKREYGDYLPESLQADLRIMLKNIRGFYLSKGTEASYEFLFRTVFDTFIDFYHPGEDILRASDGTWIVPVYLFSLGTDFAAFKDKVLVGQTSGAEAYADITVSLVNPPLSLNPPTTGLRLTKVDGTFLDNEVVQVKDDPGTTFTIDATDGTIVTDGEWVDEKGFLSWNKYLQDSYYYQEYSYEITSDIGILDYKKLIDDSVHPAGMKLFSVVTYEDYIISRMPYVEPVDEGVVQHANGYDYTQWNPPTDLIWHVLTWIAIIPIEDIIPTQMAEDYTLLQYDAVRNQPSHAFDYVAFQANREGRRGIAYTIESLESVVLDDFDTKLSKYNVLPFVDGLKTNIVDYSVDNRNLSLVVPPLADERLNAIYLRNNNYLPESFTATGAENVYTMARIPSDEEHMFVFQNGLKLLKDIEYNIVEAPIGTLSIDEAWETETITQDLIQDPVYGANSGMGNSVAIDQAGTTLIASAPWSLSPTGRAKVSINTGNNTWVEQQELIPVNTILGVTQIVRFGSYVAISADGNTVVVGAGYSDIDYDNGGGPGTSTTNSGTVFVFERVGSVWTQTAQFIHEGIDAAGGTSNLAATYGNFGWYVDIAPDGMTFSASDPQKNNSAGTNSVFWKNGSVWTLLETITLPASQTLEWNGAGSLSNDGSSFAIGSGGTDLGLVTDAGSVHTYVRSGALGTTYNYETVITSPDPDVNDYFGDNIQISNDGNKIFISSDGEDVGPILQAGAIFYFEKTAPATWVFRQKILAPTPLPYGWFAWYNLDVSYDDEVLLAGAPYEDLGGSGYDNFGALYIFGYNAGTNLYDFRLKITDPGYAADPVGQHRYGQSVSSNGDGSIIAIGSPYMDEGLNNQSGGVYTHEIDQTNVGVGGGFVLTDGLEIVSTPAALDVIEVIHLEDANVPNFLPETFIGDGATAEFVLSVSVPKGKGYNVLVAVEGVVRERGIEFDVRPDGKTIFFALAKIPGIGEVVEVSFLRNVDYDNQTFVGDGAITDFQIERVGQEFPYVPIHDIQFDYRGWNVQGAFYDNISKDVSAETTAPQDVKFNSLGNKMFVLGDNVIYEYFITDAKDISTASYVGYSFDPGHNVLGTVVKMLFSHDGYSFITFSKAPYFEVKLWTLTVPWSLAPGNLTFGGFKFPVGDNGTTSSSMDWRGDGFKWFTMDESEHNMRDYGTGGAPYSITGLGALGIHMTMTGGTETPIDFEFGNDGEHLIILGETADLIYKYHMSLPYDGAITDTGYTFSPASEDSDPRAVTFSPNGWAMYVSGSATARIYQYTSK